MNRLGLYRGVDISRKVIHLVGPVDVEMTYQLIDGLTILRQYSSELISDTDREEYSNRDITIFLNTEGGEVSQAFAMYDIIKQHDNIDICCCGPVMSAGMVILQAARKRFALPSVELMVHYGEEYNNTASNNRHNYKLFKDMKRVIESRVKVKPRTVNGWFKTETFFTAKEALRYELIDGITDVT